MFVVLDHCVLVIFAFIYNRRRLDLSILTLQMHTVGVYARAKAFSTQSAQSINDGETSSYIA